MRFCRAQRPGVLVHQAGRRTSEPAVDDRFSQCCPGDVLQLDENGRVAIEVRNREEGSGLRGERGLVLAKIRHPNREDRSFRREASPNRLMSALLNGRSHARLNADIAAGFVDGAGTWTGSAAQRQGPAGRAQGLGRAEQLVDGRIPFPGARYQAPPAASSNTVAASGRGKSTNADTRQHSAGARRGRQVLASRKAGGRGGAGPLSRRPVHQDPPCCLYQNPAARLWLIGDVGMYKPALLRTGEPGTTQVVAFVS